MENVLPRRRLIRPKISMPPLPGNRLRRPHLSRLLDQGLSAPLTLLSAPAGFGKTTVVLEWLREKESPVAWLSVDPADGEPLRFWRYLWGAAKAVLGDRLEPFPARAVQEPASLDPGALIVALIHALTEREEELILVLEDYHALDRAGAEAAPIHEGVNTLLDYLPAQAHLVISTRSDPPLQLNRRRADEQLVELRGNHLRFRESEVERWFNGLLGLGLSASQIRVLTERSEGWAAGLQMVALALHAPAVHEGRAGQGTLIEELAGTDRYIAGYLMEEVLERQPAAVRRFLLETSILERFDAALCETVTGAPSPQLMLDRLEHNNLFLVALDAQRRWYRYHHLFRDLLRERLRQRYPPEEIARLHRTACRWYENNGFLDEAIAQALMVDDFERVADLLERHGLSLIFRRSEMSRVDRSLAALPEALIRQRPLLCVMRTWLALLLLRGTKETVAGRLGEAEQALARAKPDIGRRRQVETHLDALRALSARIFTFDMAQAVALSRQALARLAEDNHVLRGIIWDNLAQAYLILGEMDEATDALIHARETAIAGGFYYSALNAYFLQALVTRYQGRLARAAALCEEALARLLHPAGAGRRPLPQAGALYTVLGTVRYQWDRLEEAAETLAQGVALLERSGDPGLHIFALGELARVRHAQGRQEEAGQLLEQAAEQRLTVYPAAIATTLDLSRRFPLPPLPHAAGALPFDWVGDSGFLRLSTTSGEAPYFPRFYYYTWATAQMRELIRKRREGKEVAEAAWRQLGELLARWRRQAVETGLSERAIELSLLQALAEEAEGEAVRARSSRALDALAQALALARPAGYIRLFVDEGPAAAALLYRAAEEGIEAEYAGEVLSHFPLEAGAGETAQAGAAPGLIEPLSERELEVLAHIAAGMTNREVAAQLSIALSTVKAHARNIYGKLNVGNRTEAVARARELRLEL